MMSTFTKVAKYCLWKRRTMRIHDGINRGICLGSIDWPRCLGALFSESLLYYAGSFSGRMIMPVKLTWSPLAISWFKVGYRHSKGNKAGQQRCVEGRQLEPGTAGRSRHVLLRWTYSVLEIGCVFGFEGVTVKVIFYANISVSGCDHWLRSCLWSDHC
jgi:hypothetical protein